jgi:MoaA/NifB/PqqE/SkfB family radical SAM enzyme
MVMQPRTAQQLDAKTIQWISRRNLLNKVTARRPESQVAAGLLPAEVGLQLTNRCNLRCKHCFQWGDAGTFKAASRAFQRDELDIRIVEKVMAETRSVKSELYLWGGETFVYSRFDRLIQLLTEDPRWTVICTNGLLIDKWRERLAPISENVVLLVSVDGFPEANDKLRGKGVSNKLMKALTSALDAKKRGELRGPISVACVINDYNVSQLYEFALYCESLGVTSLFFAYPWHMSQGMTDQMDAYYEANFQWLAEQELFVPHGPASWHGYQFTLSPQLLPTLREQLRLIYDHTWRIRVRFQPGLKESEVDSFLQGGQMPAEGKTRCFSIFKRLNVLPNGRATTCKLFPEFTVGDLTNSSVAEVWSSMLAQRARSTLSAGLTPICAKCSQLYLNTPNSAIVREAAP